MFEPLNTCCCSLFAISNINLSAMQSKWWGYTQRKRRLLCPALCIDGPEKTMYDEKFSGFSIYKNKHNAFYFNDVGAECCHSTLQIYDKFAI